MRLARGYLPVLLVLALLILLGYPLALLFGLPLALRDMRDQRKWERSVVAALPPLELPAGPRLSFPEGLEDGVLVKEDRLLDWDYELEGNELLLRQEPAESLVSWAGPLERLSELVYRLPDSLDAGGPALPIYVDGRLARPDVVKAREVPEGQRLLFGFGEARGPVLVDDRLLREGADYEDLGNQVRFAVAPPFGSFVRRVSGDYGVVEPSEGIVAFSAAPEGEPRAAASVVRLAEALSPVEGSEGRRYRFARRRVVETDRDRQLFAGFQALSDAPERPRERVDGQRRDFTFASPQGIIVVDGKRMLEGKDFLRRDGLVVFDVAPPRNAALRQYADYFLIDPEAGEVELARAPEPGERVWTSRYTVYSQPACGTGVIACFYALPQHPVPFPHWIAARVGPFLQKYPLSDERNVLRATAYTTLGTLAALALGSAVGIVLAVLFVLLRPLERALLPWVIASQTIPIIALVPVLLLVLGNFGITIQTSLLPTAIIGAYIAFFPMVVGTVKGLRSVDPLALDLMRSYAATPLAVFSKVRFPAAVPFFFTSLKLATAAALVGALVAETESNNRRGLGFQILGQVQSGNVADVWILLIISALLGIGLVAAIGLLQRLLAPWERT